jgi:hypothetical protein
MLASGMAALLACTHPEAASMGRDCVNRGANSDEARTSQHEGQGSYIEGTGSMAPLAWGRRWPLTVLGLSWLQNMCSFLLTHASVPKQ